MSTRPDSPREAVTALIREIDEKLNGLRARVASAVTEEQWAHLARQFAAIGQAADYAEANCDARARLLAGDPDLPKERSSLLSIAASLKIRNCQYYPNAGLANAIKQEIKLRIAAGDHKSWKEILDVHR